MTVAELMERLSVDEFYEWFAWFSLEAERSTGAGQVKVTRAGLGGFTPPRTMGGG